MDADEDLIPTRQSLLSRLRDWEDDASWQDFFDTYWRLIYRTALNAGLSPLEAEEVVQDTLVSVSKSIRDFRYDRAKGSFKAWLRTTTTWRIRDRIRGMQRAEGFSADIDLSELPCEELAANGLVDDGIAKNWEADWERNLLDAALDRVKTKVAPKQFQIFDLAAFKEWPTAKIAKTFNVTVAYVYLIKHRVGAHLASEVRKLREDPCRCLD